MVINSSWFFDFFKLAGLFQLIFQALADFGFFFQFVLCNLIVFFLFGNQFNCILSYQNLRFEIADRIKEFFKLVC